MSLLRKLTSGFIHEYWIGEVLGIAAANAREPEPVAGCEFGPLTDIEEIRRCPDSAVRNRAGYGGRPETWCFAARVNGELAAICWYWAGETYRRERNYWPLGPKDAKLVELATYSAYRGRGIAPGLIRYATCRMRDMGYEAMFSRVYHSNPASSAAFRKAGWQRVSRELMVRFRPNGKQRRFFFPSPQKAKTTLGVAATSSPGHR